MKGWLAAILVALPGVASAGGDATFFLVHRGLLVLGDLDAGAKVDGAGEAVLDDTGYGSRMVIMTRALVAPPPVYRDLAGRRVTLHGPDGPVCDATIGALVAVRTGTVIRDTAAALHRAQAPLPAAPLWSGHPDVNRWDDYAAATILDASGPCDGALFALPRGVVPARTRIAAAPPEWRAWAEKSFLGSSLAGGNDERVALGGSGERSRFVSVRRLGPGLALLYGYVNGSRTLVVDRVVPGSAPAQAAELYAPAPSTVTGIDADGDGALDVVVGHPEGVALVRGRGGAVSFVNGERTRWDEHGREQRGGSR